MVVEVGMLKTSVDVGRVLAASGSRQARLGPSGP
jgi:hypothetical protein